MDRENVKSLDTLLKHHIGDRKIVDAKTSRLTAPGENYGGLLLRLDLLLQDTNKKKEKFHVVAKCIPINTFLQKLFNVQVSVKKEIAFYDIVVPCLQKFQREQGVSDVMDFFPKLYASRLNLNGSEVVDEDAAIIMENLVESGYKNVDRTIGFDLETIRLILKNLTTFHAVPLALKLSQPETFKAKIEPYLEEMGPPSASPPGKAGSVLEYLQEQKEFESLIPTLKEVLKFNLKRDEEGSGRFSTVTHGDIWGNNIMVKFVEGKAASSRFLDFQNFAIRSPTRDLIFLLLSSVQLSILQRNLDNLIKFYHEQFVENLEQLGCDSSTYSFENFEEEMKTNAKLVLHQVLFMSAFVVFAKKREHSTEDFDKPPDFNTDMTPEAKERITFVIRKYKEKGWLQ